jgi:hypothetical protein
MSNPKIKFVVTPPPDADVENSDASYTDTVASGGLLILPDQTIEVNTVNEGAIPSVGTIEIDITDGVNPVTPNDVTIVGRKVTVEVPSGGGSYDLDLVDRFGNAFPTKQVTANATWDLRTLTPFDWADLYLSRLTNPPTGAQLTAVYTYFSDMVTAGLFQGSTKIELDIGGNAADHAWNARYPFDNNSSMKSEYIGSPTHDANGVHLNGTSQAVRTNAYARHLNDFDKQVSIYIRNNNFGGVIFHAGEVWSNNGFGIWEDGGASRYRNSNEGTSISPFSSGQTGLHSQSRESLSTLRMRRNAINQTFSPLTTITNYNKVADEFVIGASMAQSLALSRFKILNYCYFRVGNALTDAQEIDHYNIVQALQTALARQV